MRFKKLFSDCFGISSGILFYLFSLLVLIFPIVMIAISFDLPFWASSIMLLFSFISSYFSFIYVLVGLIGTLKGPQDIFAIAYYVYVFLLFFPDIISLLKTLFNFVYALFNKNK